MKTKFFFNKKLTKSIKKQLLLSNFRFAYIDNDHDEFYQKNINAPSYLEVGIIHNNNVIQLTINTRNLTYYFNDDFSEKQINWQPNLRQHLPNIITNIFKNYINQQ